MLYQLPNGKVIEISTEQFLDMTDEDIEYLIAYNVGDNIENPFFGSSMHNVKKQSVDDDNEIEEDLITKSSEDKLSDLDLDRSIIDD